MNKTILFNSTTVEKRAVVLVDNKVVDFVIERPDNYRILGNIYRGRVTSVIPGIQSAFVDIGTGQSAFLHAADVDASLFLEEGHPDIETYTDRSRRSKRRQIVKVPIEKVIEEGQAVLVQVSKEAIGSKSPKVTTQISIAGRYLVLVPDTDFIGVSKKESNFGERRKIKKLLSKIKPKGIGFIVRTIGSTVSEDEFINEMNTLIDAWRNAQKNALASTGPCVIHQECNITTQVIRDLFSKDVSSVYTDNEDDYREIIKYLKGTAPEMCDRVQLYDNKIPIFDKFQVEKEIERSLRRKVWLKKGGYLYFDRTEALWAIDINTGRNVGKADLEETVFATNMEAVAEIGKQLRLRDIGGIIVVDFIDMRVNEHKRRIENAMRKVLDADPTVTSMTPLSKFGLMEITRKRVRPELQEICTDICHACKGLGRVFSPATVSARIDRWLGKACAQKGRKVLELCTSEAVVSYIMDNNEKIIQDLEKLHKVTIKVIVDPLLDQDEFVFVDPETNEQITDMYL